MNWPPVQAMLWMPAHLAFCLSSSVVTYTPSVPMSMVAPTNAQTIMAPKVMANHTGSFKASPASAIKTAAQSCMSTTKNFLLLYSSSSGAHRNLNV